MDRRMKVAAGFFVLALALACWSATARASERSHLFAPKYIATSVQTNGKPHELVGHTRLHVRFFHHLGQHHHRHSHVGWGSGCNAYGAKAEITGHRVLTRTIVSTLVGCIKPLERQDRFFARFFRADPRFSFHHHRLRLATNGTVIRLQRASRK